MRNDQFGMEIGDVVRAESLNSGPMQSKFFVRAVCEDVPKIFRLRAGRAVTHGSWVP